MKIRNYKMIDNDILIYGKGKTINGEKLKTMFDDCELLKIKGDLKNKTIDNYLLNSWDVIYYIKLKKENGKVLTFKNNEYDLIDNLK